jgi:ubiquitin
VNEQQHRDMDDRVTSLEKNVVEMSAIMKGVVSSVGELGTNIKSLSKDFQDSRRPDTRTQISFISLLLLIGGLVYAPIYNRQVETISALKDTVLKLETVKETTVTKREMDMRVAERDRYEALREKYYEAKYGRNNQRGDK